MVTLDRMRDSPWRALNNRRRYALATVSSHSAKLWHLIHPVTVPRISKWVKQHHQESKRKIAHFHFNLLSEQSNTSVSKTSHPPDYHVYSPQMWPITWASQITWLAPIPIFIFSASIANTNPSPPRPKPPWLNHTFPILFSQQTLKSQRSNLRRVTATWDKSSFLGFQQSPPKTPETHRTKTLPVISSLVFRELTDWPTCDVQQRPSYSLRNPIHIPSFPLSRTYGPLSGYDPTSGWPGDSRSKMTPARRWCSEPHSLKELLILDHGDNMRAWQPWPNSATRIPSYPHQHSHATAAKPDRSLTAAQKQLTRDMHNGSMQQPQTKSANHMLVVHHPTACNTTDSTYPQKFHVSGFPSFLTIANSPLRVEYFRKRWKHTV